MNPITRKIMSKLVMQPKLLAKHTRNGRRLKNPKIREKCMAINLPMPDCHRSFLSPIYLSGFSNVYHFACVWSTALKVGWSSWVTVVLWARFFLNYLQDKSVRAQVWFFVGSRFCCFLIKGHSKCSLTQRSSEIRSNSTYSRCISPVTRTFHFPVSSLTKSPPSIALIGQ